MPSIQAPTLKVATYNIHKGFSRWNLRMTVHLLRDALRSLGADIVFLQEVQGLHRKHAVKVKDWPDVPQHAFLAEDVWLAHAYGPNVAYDHGHHGNAILSRWPIVTTVNDDVTDLRFERRGMLHCGIKVPFMSAPVHCVSVHLSLFGRSRTKQVDTLSVRLKEWGGDESPFIVAGDFNDWDNRAGRRLAANAQLSEVVGGVDGTPACTFPVSSPRLRLDRIYVRGFTAVSTEVHCLPPWSEISDHAALSAHLAPASRVPLR